MKSQTLVPAHKGKKGARLGRWQPSLKWDPLQEIMVSKTGAALLYVYRAHRRHCKNPAANEKARPSV